MTPRAKAGLGVFAVVVVGGALYGYSMMRRGFATQDEPSRLEAVVARSMRRWSTPADLRKKKNPVPFVSTTLGEARAHFADHCAICHGNDGKGGSGMGRKMYPRTPDMTLDATQSLSDGELFAIIENGVRLTGMPGFGEGTAESAHGSWTLVHFIRHMPQITAEEVQEMEGMNPVSPAEMKESKDEEQFLEADTQEAPAASPKASNHNAHGAH